MTVAVDLLPRGRMADDEDLQNLLTRTRQLESYLLRSPEYLHKADQDLKRQVTMLYLAIALLLVFQLLFAVSQARHLPLSVMALIVFTSILAIINCILLIRTKNYLRRVNENWLKPEERDAIVKLRNQHAEIRQRTQETPTPRRK
jgi:hypothetical protein